MEQSTFRSTSHSLPLLIIAIQLSDRLWTEEEAYFTRSEWRLNQQISLYKIKRRPNWWENIVNKVQDIQTDKETFSMKYRMCPNCWWNINSKVQKTPKLTRKYSSPNPNHVQTDKKFPFMKSKEAWGDDETSFTKSKMTRKHSSPIDNKFESKYLSCHGNILHKM